MIVLLPLLRRLSLRSRVTIGVALSVVGVALIALAVTVTAGLLVHGIVATVVGAIVLAHAWSSDRRGYPAR